MFNYKSDFFSALNKLFIDLREKGIKSILEHNIINWIKNMSRVPDQNVCRRKIQAQNKNLPQMKPKINICTK